MIGSLIGAGLKVAGGIYGGIKSAQAMRQVQQNLEDAQARNQAWYDKNYYEDATKRADAQRILQQTEDAIRNRKRQSAAAAAVTGGTQEAQALENAANAQAIANAMTDIAVSGEQRKDNIEAQYQQTRNALDQQQNNLLIGKAHTIAQGVKGVTDAAGNFVGNF